MKARSWGWGLEGDGGRASSRMGGDGIREVGGQSITTNLVRYDDKYAFSSRGGGRSLKHFKQESDLIGFVF